VSGPDGPDAEGPDAEAVPASRPVLRIVRGDPSPEELAALTAVLAAASAGSGEPEEETGPASAWTERESLVRRPLTPGPNAWRMSGWR
jgi:hypothetical protein